MSTQAKERLDAAQKKLTELTSRKESLTEKLNQMQADHTARVQRNILGEEDYGSKERTKASDAIQYAQSNLTHLSEDLDALQAYMPALELDATIERANNQAATAVQFAIDGESQARRAIATFNTFASQWRIAMTTRRGYDAATQLMDKAATAAKLNSCPLTPSESWSFNVDALLKDLSARVSELPPDGDIELDAYLWRPRAADNAHAETTPAAA